MGSLNASGVPVVSKTSTTFRNRGGRQIYRTVSTNDTKATIVNSPPVRVLGSGSIVRGNNVNYYDELSYAVYMMGRSSSERIASEANNPRTAYVELGDNQTDAVIPTALDSDIPQIASRHSNRTRFKFWRSIGVTYVGRRKKETWG
jgi:hypothetical protein